MAFSLLDMFKAVPDAETPIGDPAEMRKTYRYWRIRQLYSSFIGYAIYYFVRKNISIALPVMEKELGFTKAALGMFLTLHGVLYGISKFFNGYLGDRANPRYFMAAGLAISALLNVCFGLSSSVLAFGIFWMFNGWFQGMGFPPCARILSHWFSPKERGTKWALWNSSHQVGLAAIVILTGYLVHWGWRACFIVPAAISLVAVLFIVNRIRDTPGSLGLPPVEVYMEETESQPHEKECHENREEFNRFLKTHVFSNPYIWFISFANFFVYVLRYAVVDWAPSYLSQAKGAALHHTGWMVAGFEVFGLVGSLVAGWLTDRYLKGRRAPVCVVYMLFSVVFVVLFWKIPSGQTLHSAVLLLFAGFFIYGPQFLVGVMTCDIATKRAAATAIGLTGFFGYLSGIVSGWGLGFIVDKWGWDAAFVMLAVCGVLAAFFFSLCWKARPAGDCA